MVRLAPLRELGDGARELFGGKARGLARLLAAGARVPEGFAASACPGGPDAWDGEARAAFRRAAAALLAHGPLAVRSSAVGEDASSRSFAGLFATVLGVATTESALAAAAEVAASAASPRVAAYAPGPSPAMGLVVQACVAARAAGVCFTRDPAGRDGAVVVEAVAGSGEQLVSGRASPERWRVYRSGLGGRLARAEDARGVLSPAEAEEVATGAEELAGKLGEPLDLEWALDASGTLWWLQARPITAAGVPEPLEVERSVPGADDGPVTVWSTWNVRETMPEPLLPLTWGLWREDVLPVVTSHLFGVPRGSEAQRALLGLDLVNGRMAFNMNAMRASPLLGRLLVRVVSIADQTTGEAVARLEAEGVLVPRRLPGSRLLLTLRALLAGLLASARVARGLFPRRALRVIETDCAAVARRPPVAGLSDAALLAELRIYSSPACRRILSGLQVEGLAMAVYGLARHAFRAHPRAVSLLGSGIAAGPTTEISIEVDALVEAARPIARLFEGDGGAGLLARLGSEPEAAAWLGLLRGFLARFGHRGPAEFDLATPRWGEDPSMIVTLVKVRLGDGPREGVAARMAALAAERERVLSGAIAASPLLARPFLALLARAVPLYMPLREAPKHHGVVVFDRIRKAALELGRRLAARGVLAGADEVFLLTWAELHALAGGGPAPADLAATLAERAARHERFRARRPVDLVRSDGIPVEERTPSAAADGVLRGVGVSGGSAAGPVRRLASPDPAAMREGDVLVLVHADPGWTPLFPRAAAVVMEVGGLMCHAAVVARELGVPAVFGVRRATELLAEGALVRVDGEEGTVRPA